MIKRGDRKQFKEFISFIKENKSLRRIIKMKKYYTPDIDIITLHTNDIMNASKTIGEAGEGAEKSFFLKDFSCQEEFLLCFADQIFD